MKISELTYYWTKNEVIALKEKVENLENSGMGKINGFDIFLKMRKDQLSLAESALIKIKIKET
jgi:hypothetical protein